MNDELRKVRKLLEEAVPYLEDMRNENMNDYSRVDKLALTRLIKEIYKNLEKPLDKLD